MTAQSAEPARARLPFEVWVIGVIGFFTVVGYGIIAPSLPSLAKEFGVGSTVMTLAVSGFSAGRLTANVAFARFLRSFRLHTVLWVGLAAQSVFTIVAGLAPVFSLLVVMRTFSGMGSAAFTIASTALILVLVPAQIRGRAMSVFFGGTSLGTVAGPVIGGVLATWGARVPLIVYGSALALAAVMAFILLHRARDARTADASTKPGEEPAGRLASLFGLFADKIILAAFMCHIVAGWIFYGMRAATFPLELAALGYTTGLIGLVLSVSSIVQIGTSSVAGSFSDRFGRRTPLLLGLGLGLVGVSSLVFASEVWVTFVALAIIGAASGAVASVSPALLGDSPRGSTSLALGTFWAISDLGGVIGPILSGLLSDAWGFPAALAAAGLLVALAMVAVLRTPAGRPAEPGAAPVGH